MTRKPQYFSAPAPETANWWEVRASDSLARTVYEAETAPVFTGLLDAQGNRLFRKEEREPIGFIVEGKTR